MEPCYIAIDLKSFYASVECRERGLDPLDACLVVADETRTEKTICLAVTPPLKSFGVPGRPRLFEVQQRVQGVNAMRRRHAPGGQFAGSTTSAAQLAANPALKLDFIVTPPRMAHYIDISTKIYSIYLQFVAPEDIIVYSIDEVFIYATPYLRCYNMTAAQLAAAMIHRVLHQTGITATAGVGSNLYLCKVAMDILAKRIPPDQNGVRIAQLTEQGYRRTLWDHTPITDFWRVGRGYAKRLAKYGMHTMGDVARCSIQNEDLLYHLFGKNAQLLIDHAWGWESCTIADVKAYRPAKNSLGSGQVLPEPYTANMVQLVLAEMADSLGLELCARGLVCNSLVLTVGYDMQNMARGYTGPTTTDPYGRTLPKHGHGTCHLPGYTNDCNALTQAALQLYNRVGDKNLLVRRLNLVAGDVLPAGDAPATQLSLFDTPADTDPRQQQLQNAMLKIRSRYGKNAILKGRSLQQGATARQRNDQIGGHKA